MRIRELRPWGRTGRLPSRVKEIYLFAHGAIVHIVFDRDPPEVLERLDKIVHELRASFSTHARGGK